MTQTTAPHCDAIEDIKRVLTDDLACYLARDKPAWERNWVQDARFQSIMECGTMQIAPSYDAFRRNVFAAMDAEPEPVKAEIQIDNLRIEVHGTIAWATFEEVVLQTSNPLVVRNHSHNFRLLERSDGTWRILFHGCWAEPARDTETPALEVTAQCEVAWMNAAARDRLPGFDGLAIHHGILRASEPCLTAALHDAVAGAHDLTGFGKFNRAASQGGGTVTFPVVLGEDDGGALLLCWVKVADGRVYILFGEDRDLSQQIEVAKVVYRLSGAQTDVLHHIAQGRDLAAAAVALGITKNTARTHLRRVYEKVGVSSQIELLRLLISFDV